MVMNVRKIDVGRLIVIPISTFLVTLNILTVYKDLRVLFPVDTIKAFTVIYHLLIVCFYALIILLYFLRSQATSTSKSFMTNGIAIMATFIPFTFPFLGKPPSIKPEILVVVNLIIIFGIALSIYALGALGRSFSIIPQARRLVQRGPYRIVRHPIYLSELISVFGVVLAGLTILKVAMFLLFVAFQVYRAFQEEKLLDSVFPEYKQYCSKTARFIPAIF